MAQLTPTYSQIMSKLSRLSVRLCVDMISIYRSAISPLYPPMCRYTPSCSAYAQEALRKHGLKKGTILTIKRLMRCHPFVQRPMHDPVP